MKNSYLRSLIKSGIKAAAAFIKSDSKSDNKAKSETPEITAPQKTECQSCAFPDSFYPTSGDIYVPDTHEAEKAEVPFIELTRKQAIEQGYSFRKKSRSIRITNYHGTPRSIIIPSKIGGKTVNELSARAFKETQLDRVEIPGSIKKAGDSLFSGSEVREVIFGSGLRVIPQKTFFCCTKLSRVVLPDTVFEIQEMTFSHCKSLEYICLPDSLFIVREYAFWNSGLKGFSSKFPMRLNNGNAFTCTPLQSMYKLIAARNTGNELQVLLTGNNAKIKFPKKRVVLKNSSVHSDCEFDFSECTDLNIENAFYETCTTRFSRTIIVRHGQDGYYFGENAAVKYTDGSPYPELLTPTKKTRDAMTVKYMGRALVYQELPGEYVHFGVKSLRITSEIVINIRKHAFNDQKLESLEIDNYFGANAEIFSEKCTALREVRWNGKYNKNRYVQYIPPTGAITELLHRELLKAFCRSDNGFFDCSVIDKLFSDKEFRSRYGSKTDLIRISRRQLILIAIDVLRSTDRQFTNGTKAYSDYLRRHIRFAKTVCEKLKTGYPEYAEFLAAFI